MTYQAFSVNMLTSDFGQVTFNPAFAQTPITITTPYWHNGSRPVPTVSTATSVTKQAATILGNYGDSDLFLKVLAIDPSSKDINGMPVVAARQTRT